MTRPPEARSCGTPPRLALPTVGRANFSIANCDDCRTLRTLRATRYYGNRDALEVARNLDKKIEDLLRQAAA